MCAKQHYRDKLSNINAFAIADDILGQTVKNIVEVIQSTAYINCDFSDICSIVKDSGDMYTATSLTSGINRIDESISKIKSSALLKTSVNGATGIMLCITASNDVGLEEIDKISSAISDVASNSANLIFGMNFSDTMDDVIKVVLLATKKRTDEKKLIQVHMLKCTIPAPQARSHCYAMFEGLGCSQQENVRPNGNAESVIFRSCRDMTTACKV